MGIHTKAEQEATLLDTLCGTDKVWTGSALNDETGETATAYGNTAEQAKYNAAERLSKE